MKVVVGITFLLTGIASVIGSIIPTTNRPSSRAVSARTNDLSAAPVKWMGQITPGGEVTTLYGQAHDVYDQILAINPEYKAEDFPTNGIVSSAKLKKRDQITCLTDFPPATVGGNDNAIRTASQILQIMGGFFMLEANSCAEVECIHYSGIGGGIWGCNKNTTASVMIPSKRLGDMAAGILDNCAPVFYQVHSGTSYYLHEAFYSANDNLDVLVQRC